MFVFLVSLFLVLNERFGRSSKSGTFDNLTSVSSAYSPDCLSSSAGDISNFPQQPFMSSCRLVTRKGNSTEGGTYRRNKDLVSLPSHITQGVRQEIWTEAQTMREGLAHQSPDFHIR